MGECKLMSLLLIVLVLNILVYYIFIDNKNIIKSSIYKKIIIGIWIFIFYLVGFNFKISFIINNTFPINSEKEVPNTLIEFSIDNIKEFSINGYYGDEPICDIYYDENNDPIENIIKEEE
jgi:hypothetical protein